MKSSIANYLNGKFDPIVLIKTNEKPDDIKGPKEGRGGCVMSFVAQCIAKRKAFVFEDAKEFQATFLSKGADSAKNREEYLKKLESRPKNVREMFAEGERIYEDFETAYGHISSRPIYDSEDYVVFKPLEELEEGEIPDSVIFTVNAFELMLLLQLDGSHRVESNYVCVPQSSACQLIGCFTFEQDESEDPHLLLGPVDLAARNHMKHFIPNDYVTLSMPWKLFMKLEELSEDSLFQSHLFNDFDK